MKTPHNILLSIAFVLFAMASYGQSAISSSRRAFDPEARGVARQQHDEDYNDMYVNFQRDIYQDKPTGIHIKDKSPKYSKMYLYPDYVLSYEVDPSVDGVGHSKLPNGGKYVYLYMAYVALVPDAQGNIKEQVLLFFSPYNIRAKKKYDSDDKTAYVKEIVSDIDKNPILVAETHPDVFLEVSQYATGDNGPKIKVFGTTTYIYDINSLHPNKTPMTIGKLYQYEPGLRHAKKYETAMLVNYNQNGKITSTTEYIPKEGGESLLLAHMKTFDESGSLLEAGFEISTNIKVGETTRFIGTWKNGYSTKATNYTDKKVLSFGIDFRNDKTYFHNVLIMPDGITKNWTNDIRDFNTEPDLLGDLRQNLGREPVDDGEQLREFLTNFHKLDEYVIIDETVKNVYGAPKKYVYKGTYNEAGIPHGWGLMYAVNTDDEYYLGQFKNGMPDGLGIRQDFKLDKPESRYNSRGMHVGNTMVYGISYTGTANNNGYNVKYGDFRQGELSGKGSHIWYQGYESGVGMLRYGDFQNGNLHGLGSYFYHDKKEVGNFENGKFVSGISVSDKAHDSRFYPGAVVMYQGRKYVIMGKDNDRLMLDNGFSVSTKADVTLTGERSVRTKACLVCNGTGYLNPTTNTIFSGVTKTQKSYETGPTGYIIWEKTTTTTTAPVTTHRTSRCTACSGGLAGNEPVPLATDLR